MAAAGYSRSWHERISIQSVCFKAFLTLTASFFTVFSCLLFLCYFLTFLSFGVPSSVKYLYRNGTTQLVKKWLFWKFLSSRLLSLFVHSYDILPVRLFADVDSFCHSFGHMACEFIIHPLLSASSLNLFMWLAVCLHT